MPSSNPGFRVTSGVRPSLGSPERLVIGMAKPRVDTLGLTLRDQWSARPLTSLKCPSFSQCHVLSCPCLCPLPSSQDLVLGVNWGQTALPRSPLTLQVSMCPKLNIVAAAGPHSADITTIHPVGRLAALDEPASFLFLTFQTQLGLEVP